jgi:hypothetical protein
MSAKVAWEPWRRLALGLLLLSTAGVAAELVLLEHYEDLSQRTPLALLALGLVAGGALAARATPGRVRVLQAVAVAQVLAAAVGIFLHVRSNVEFELELRPGVGGWPLVVETLRGAIPALAPGAMAQLGLLGLLVCFRHPAVVEQADVSSIKES